MVCFCKGVRKNSILGASRLTGGKHALNKVRNITQNDTITLRIGFPLGSELLDLDTLENRYWELFFQSGWIVEYGTETISRKLKVFEGTYFRAPVVI